MKNGRVRIGLTNQGILNGTEDLTTWSDEELMRGQKKSKTGKWTGRPPMVVPKAIHDELVRRKMSEAHDLLRDNLVEATNVLIELATNEDVESSVRLKAATTIMDRVLGKAPERVQLETQAPWMMALNAGIVSVANTVMDTTSRSANEEDLTPYQQIVRYHRLFRM